MTIKLGMESYVEFLRTATRIYYGPGTIGETGLHIDGERHEEPVACTDPYPLTGEELLQVPEGYRQHEVYQVFTGAEFENGDSINIDGYGTFRVIRVDQWPRYNNITIAASNP